MDDTDYKKQRSSLILISIAIILYLLGDGEIGTKGGVFGGTIVFGKPEILERAGLIIYLWLNWRYVLSCKPMIKKFESHFSCLLYQSNTYKKYIAEIFEQLKEKVPSLNHVDRFMTQSLLWNKKGNGLLPPLIKNKLWPNKYFYHKSNHAILESDIENIIQGNVILAFPKPDVDENNIAVIKAPLIKLFLLELWVLIVAAWAHKPFSDILAPFVISLYAAYLLLSRGLI